MRECTWVGVGGDELAGNALAERWRGRLVDAGPRAGEFGFTVARSAMLSGDELVQLVDPLAPDVWVVEDRATGTITHTVGDRTPAARGALTTAAITAGSRSAIAFYTDAAGVEWPIPAAETDEFCIGYVGDGPRRLVKILKLLSDDAAAALVEVSQTMQGRTRTMKVKLADKLGALRLLAAHTGVGAAASDDTGEDIGADPDPPVADEA